MSDKQDLVNYVLSLPGASSWYGADKLQGYANGTILSVNYDKWLSWWNSGHKDWIAADVQRHTGLPNPLATWKNTNPYGAIIKFLERQLENQQEEYNLLHNQQGNPDNNPIALGVISDNITRTQAALIYYKHLAGQ